MITLTRRSACGLLALGLAAARVPPAGALDAKTARQRYLKAASALERLVKAPPDDLSKEELPAFDELRKVLLDTAGTLREAAGTVSDGDEKLESRVQEQIAATMTWLDGFKKALSNQLRKTAETAQTIIGNLK